MTIWQNYFTFDIGNLQILESLFLFNQTRFINTNVSYIGYDISCINNICNVNIKFSWWYTSFIMCINDRGQDINNCFTNANGYSNNDIIYIFKYSILQCTMHKYNDCDQGNHATNPYKYMLFVTNTVWRVFLCSLSLEWYIIYTKFNNNIDCDALEFIY